MKNKIIDEFKLIVSNYYDNVTISKKAVYIMEELLSNVINYYKNKSHHNYFSLNCELRSDEMLFEVENTIRASDESFIESQINYFNSLNEEELKNAYQQFVTRTLESDQTPSLGLISIRRKTNTVIDYWFKDQSISLKTFGVKVQLRVGIKHEN